MQAQDLKPVNDICIIKPVMEKEKQSFGFAFTDANKDQPIEGKVISVSPTFKIDSIKVGSVVVWKKYAPRELSVNGELYFAAESEDIIAIV